MVLKIVFILLQIGPSVKHNCPASDGEKVSVFPYSDAVSPFPRRVPPFRAVRAPQFPGQIFENVTIYPKILRIFKN